MAVRSLNSSVLKWPNEREIKRALNEWAAEVRCTHHGIVRIGYFGSYARGDWGVGSDVDLVIIVEKSDQEKMNRPASFPKDHLPVQADLLVYTSDEWNQLMAADTRFAKTLTKEAVWL
ncbi:MAG: nucleotidyltransferase domain-containing protein [Spirochaetales bacterium]|jgi:uncharacterized protein|nr:nucleotidyltransferase domain-containing protein [Spirochaetales bacterium]